MPKPSQNQPAIKGGKWNPEARLGYHWTDDYAMPDILSSGTWEGGSVTTNPAYRYNRGDTADMFALVFDLAKGGFKERKDPTVPWPEWEWVTPKDIDLFGDDPLAQPLSGAFLGFGVRTQRAAKRLRAMMKEAFDEPDMFPVYFVPNVAKEKLAADKVNPWVDYEGGLGLMGDEAKAAVEKLRAEGKEVKAYFTPLGYYVVKYRDPDPVKTAGDAKPTKGNTREFAGIPVVVEYDEGEIRRGKTEDGKEWERVMPFPYGYILGTKGAGDKEGVDVYLGANENAPNVYVVEQLKEDGSFDEFKCLLGFDTEEEATDAYLKNYPKSWKDERLGEVAEFPIGEFREAVTENQDPGEVAKVAAALHFRPLPYEQFVRKNPGLAAHADADDEYRYEENVEHFSTVKFPLTLYRAFEIEKGETLGMNHMGVHWTWVEDSADAYFGPSSMWNPGTRKLKDPVLVIVKASLSRPDEVDWDRTLLANMLNPEENEVWLKNGAKLQLLGVDYENGYEKPEAPMTITADDEGDPVSEMFHRDPNAFDLHQAAGGLRNGWITADGEWHPFQRGEYNHEDAAFRLGLVKGKHEASGMEEAFEKGAIRVANSSKAIFFEARTMGARARGLVRDFLLTSGANFDRDDDFVFEWFHPRSGDERIRGLDGAIEWLENPRMMQVAAEVPSLQALARLHDEIKWDPTRLDTPKDPRTVEYWLKVRREKLQRLYDGLIAYNPPGWAKDMLAEAKTALHNADVRIYEKRDLGQAESALESALMSLHETLYAVAKAAGKRLRFKHGALMPVERYSGPGGEEGYFYAPEGEAPPEFGNIRTEALIDDSQLYRGTNTYDFLEKSGRMDDPVPAELRDKVREGIKKIKRYFTGDKLVQSLPDDARTIRDVTAFSGLGPEDFYFPVLQRAAAKILRGMGYKGAFWSEEDDLTPQQYQIWDRSAVKARPRKASHWLLTAGTKIMQNGWLALDGQFYPIAEEEEHFESLAKMRIFQKIEGLAIRVVNYGDAAIFDALEDTPEARAAIREAIRNNPQIRDIEIEFQDGGYERSLSPEEAIDWLERSYHLKTADSPQITPHRYEEAEQSTNMYALQPDRRKGESGAGGTNVSEGAAGQSLPSLEELSPGEKMDAGDFVSGDYDLGTTRTGPTRSSDKIGAKTAAGPGDYSDFHALADAQRGEPEAAMLRVQHHPLCAGVYSFVVEHVGDLTHRMSEENCGAYPGGEFGYDYVASKVRRCLDVLTQGYGFEREMQGNLKANYRHYLEKGKGAETYDQLVLDLKARSKAYAVAHSKLPVVNRTQATARDAAVALGEWRFADAVKHLEALQAILRNGKESWVSAASALPRDKVAAEDVPGTVYLLHTEKPFHHLRHYLGWTRDLEGRLEEHRRGTGANIMRVLKEQGIKWELARTWKNVTRKFERRLKTQGGLSRHCPVCAKEGLICPSRSRPKALETPEGTDYVEICKTGGLKGRLEYHWAGDTLWVDMFMLRPEDRGKGGGRIAYTEFEGSLPKSVHYVRLFAADTGAGPSDGFWEKMGFEHVYAGEHGDEHDHEMWKGVNGHATPAPLDSRVAAAPSKFDDPALLPKLEEALRLHDEIKGSPIREKVVGKNKEQTHASDVQACYEYQREALPKLLAVLKALSPSFTDTFSLDVPQYDLNAAEKCYADYENGEDEMLDAALYQQEKALMQLHAWLTREINNLTDPKLVQEHRDQMRRREEMRKRREERQKRLTSASKWLYHVTFAAYLEGIGRHGLTPGAEPGITGGGSGGGKVFVSEAGHVHPWFFAAENWAYHRSDDPAGDGLVPVVIRFPRKDVRNPAEDEFGGEGDYSADHVPPDNMQVWNGRKWDSGLWLDDTVPVADDEGYILRDGPLRTPKLAAGKGVFYHATMAYHIPSIAKQGLKPSEEPNWGGDLGYQSYGKVYFARTPRNAMYYASIVFRQTLESSGRAWAPVCLRVRIPEGVPVAHGVVEYGVESNESWVNVVIPPQNIEVWWRGKWNPIQQVAGWDWEDMQYEFSEDEGVYTDWEGSPVGDTAMEAEAEAKRSFTPKRAAQRYTAKQVGEHVEELQGHDILDWNSIMQYPVWELKKVRLDEVIGADLTEYDEPGLAEYYATLKTPFPAVVLDADGAIIDGNHRVHAALARGDTEIWAYVPVVRRNASRIGSVEFLPQITAVKPIDKGIADMLRFASWLLLAVDYADMFKQLLKANPAFKPDIDREIQWAKTVLKKADRITWYLRWVRLSYEGQLAGRRDPAIPTPVPDLLAKDIAAYNAKGKTHITQQDVDKVNLRDLKHSLEHFFSLEDASVQSLQLGYETPNEVTEKLGRMEEEIRVRVESEMRTIAEPEKGSGDKVFIKFGNGWAWWLLGRAYCPEEARAMGHCGNRPRMETEDRIISLREPISKAGVTRWSPHLTFVIDEKGFLGEMKGRGNDKPAKRYHPYIITLFKDNRIKGTKGATWFPSHNFRLSDLTDEERKGIYAANPNFMDPATYYKAHGRDEGSLAQMAERLNIDPGGFNPEWDAFVVRQWDNVSEFVDDVGNGLAREAADWATEHEDRRRMEEPMEVQLPDSEEVSDEIVKFLSDGAIRHMMEALQRDVPELLAEFNQMQTKYTGNPKWTWRDADDATVADLLYWVERNTGYDTSVWANIQLAYQKAAANDYHWALTSDLEYNLTSEEIFADDEHRCEIRWGADDQFDWKVAPVYETISFEKAKELADPENDHSEKERDLELGEDININLYEPDSEYGNEDSDEPMDILEKMYEKGIPRFEDERQLEMFRENRPPEPPEEEPTPDEALTARVADSALEWYPGTDYNKGDFIYDEPSGWFQAVSVPGRSGDDRPEFAADPVGITMDKGINWVSVTRDELAATVRNLMGNEAFQAEYGEGGDEEEEAEEEPVPANEAE